MIYQNNFLFLFCYRGKFNEWVSFQHHKMSILLRFTCYGRMWIWVEREFSWRSVSKKYAVSRQKKYYLAAAHMCQERPEKSYRRHCAGELSNETPEHAGQEVKLRMWKNFPGWLGHWKWIFRCSYIFFNHTFMLNRPSYLYRV